MEAKQSLRQRLTEVMEPCQGGPRSTRLSLVVDLSILVLTLVS